MEYLFYTLLFLGVLFVPYFVQKSKRRRKTKMFISNLWGKEDRSNLEQKIKDFEPVAGYFNNIKKNNDTDFYIDDITWNDLNMDVVYNRINHTMSVCGEQYLYLLLRRPTKDPKEIKRRIDIISDFSKCINECIEIQYLLSCYGKNRQYDFSKYFFESSGRIAESNIRYILQDIILIISPLLLLINSFFGVIVAGLLIINIITHYMGRRKILENLSIITWIVELLKCTTKINKKSFSVLKGYPLKTALKRIQSRKVNSIYYLIFESQSVVVEYIKALFLAELITYGKLMKLLERKRSAFRDLYNMLGEIDAFISIASLRDSLPSWCIPAFLQSNQMYITLKESYHPLINQPVTNDLDMRECILLTGSNASGKSTFLKSVAINAIFAQTLCTCCASEYTGSFVNVYTSMALRDDIISAESYYIVEIKSLKRILDAVLEKSNVLCFVDEVLRGTNTIERIAASSEILKRFFKEGSLCMAATHDLELADILAGIYKNYHFQETITEDDIQFDYKLYPGKTYTRNAIQLLRLMDYDTEIVLQADINAKKFLDTGSWK